jgi:hypothetical protein
MKNYGIHHQEFYRCLKEKYAFMGLIYFFDDSSDMHMSQNSFTVF